jgi:hypothetical protein
VVKARAQHGTTYPQVGNAHIDHQWCECLGISPGWQQSALLINESKGRATSMHEDNHSADTLEAVANITSSASSIA